MLSRLRKKRAHQRYQLFTYDDIDQYRRIQEAGNKRKIENVWVQKDNIAFLSDFIGSADFGICHGTRRGFEQKWFSESLNCRVIGTEISETAKEFPNTVQWDFPDDNPEWFGKADFVYSNSFDHAYDPGKALNAWMRTLSPKGVCIIEHSSSHVGSTELDPFGADLEIMPYLILKWGQGRYWVTEILEAPAVPPELAFLKFLIVRNCPRS